MGLRDEPLPLTQSRIDAAVRLAVKKRILRYVLLGSTVVGGGLTARETGALDAFFAHAVAAREAPTESALVARLTTRIGEVEAGQAAMGRRVLNIDRKMNWLVLQEVRRQEREGRTANPPEDIE